MTYCVSSCPHALARDWPSCSDAGFSREEADTACRQVGRVGYRVCRLHEASGAERYRQGKSSKAMLSAKRSWQAF